MHRISYPNDLLNSMTDVIDKQFGADHPVAADLVQRWRRYRALADAGCRFGLTEEGMFMIQDLRASTDQRIAELEDADLRWEQAGSPDRGRHTRRFEKARLNVLKAMVSEKDECEVTLVQFSRLDIGPNDDAKVDQLLEGFEEEFGIA
jgi:hypothetical protein